MIRKSLPQTKAATYSIQFPSPDPAFHQMPVPRGTGFFIDPTGYFLTARHVIDGVRVEEGRLRQTPSPGNWGMQGVGGGPELVAEWPEYDLALLKFDFQRNSRVRRETPHKESHQHVCCSGDA
jgi:S1-C subfamily serine protease